MTVYCDLQMSTELALELLKFVDASRAGQPHLAELFDEIERQVKDSLECEGNDYSEGLLTPQRRH